MSEFKGLSMHLVLTLLKSSGKWSEQELDNVKKYAITLCVDDRAYLDHMEEIASNGFATIAMPSLQVPDNYPESIVSMAFRTFGQIGLYHFLLSPLQITYARRLVRRAIDQECARASTRKRKIDGAVVNPLFLRAYLDSENPQLRPLADRDAIESLWQQTKDIVMRPSLD